MTAFKGANCQRVQVTSRFLLRARLSDSKDRRYENKVWLDLEKGVVVEKEEKSFLSVHYYL